MLIRTPDMDIVTADRVRCAVCGLECDLGDCDFDDIEEPVCPECGGATADPGCRKRKNGRPPAIVLAGSGRCVRDGGVVLSSDAIASMAEEGLSISESAIRLGVPKSTYREFLVKHGLRDLYGRCKG